MTDVNSLIKKDLYKILGCDQDSSIQELKQAYHRKLLATHPDKNKNIQTNNEKFQDVKLAWKVLGDPYSRKQYDNKYKQAQLELEGATIYANLSYSDLEATEDKDVLSYPCRCGNSYLVEKGDLEEPNCIIQVPCQDCTFVIAIAT